MKSCQFLNTGVCQNVVCAKLHKNILVKKKEFSTVGKRLKQRKVKSVRADEEANQILSLSSVQSQNNVPIPSVNVPKITHSKPPKEIKIPKQLNDEINNILDTLSIKNIKPTCTLDYSHINTTHPIRIFTFDQPQQIDFFHETILDVTGKGMNNTLRYIGVDTETFVFRTNNANKMPSTIQISFGHGLVGVYQVFRMSSQAKFKFPASLQALFTSKHIAKCGVGLSHDVVPLKTYFGIDMVNCIDIDAIATAFNIPCSLQSLTYLFCENTVLPKSKKLIFSNWDAKNITKNALIYAAKDAIYSREVFANLFKLPSITYDTAELKKLIQSKEVQ
ncbi:ribonuclease H-like domain-containing protein, partial [Globomyces pollinis-pini]